MLWGSHNMEPRGSKPTQDRHRNSDHQIPIPNQSLVNSLWHEINAIKKERESLSSSIAPTVARFQGEGKIIGIKILDPQAQQDLRILYDRIEAYTRECSELYRRIEAAETVVPLQEKSDDGGNIYQLKQQKRSIQNRRHKLNKKLKSGIRPRNPIKLQEWQMQLAALDAEEQYINDQLG